MQKVSGLGNTQIAMLISYFLSFNQQSNFRSDKLNNPNASIRRGWYNKANVKVLVKHTHHWTNTFRFAAIAEDTFIAKAYTDD